MPDTLELYDAAGSRELDRRLIDGCGIPGYTLMRAAAAACWREIGKRWPRARRILVFCGSGNNGGDGFEVARLARRSGCSVQVIDLARHEATGDAATARRAWVDDGGGLVRWSDEKPLLEATDVVVDAIFGTGLSRAPSGIAQEAITAVNRWHGAGGCVCAVDVPSGLNIDTGVTPGTCIAADLTVTFIGRKFGLYTGTGPDHAGRVVYDPLVAEATTVERPTAVARLLDHNVLTQWFAPRKPSAHKGSNGRVLIIGGDYGMAGAVLMAARAALRCGAGMVTVATRPEHAETLVVAQPEVMFRGVAGGAELEPMLSRADVVAVGPGLGQSAWSRELWQVARQASRLVVDADALNLLAQDPQRNAAWILTPHPGEAARLLACTTREVQADRPAALRHLADRYGGYPLIKGVGTLVWLGSDATPSEIGVCPYGNPGMATGGMGDALTGVIASCLAQGLSSAVAASAGVLVHALAGDAAARADGERGLLPSDLIAQLRTVVNPEAAAH